MRSSGSTPTDRPERTIPLGIVLVGDDDPKRCTGRRLIARGWAAELRGRSVLPGSVLLDPRAATPLSRADRWSARRGGLVAVDCSWNRLEGRRALLLERGSRPGAIHHRRLPWLVAANPQHYGRVAELNTAEALAASLYLLGEPERAQRLLTEFPGETTLLRLNEAWLARYADADGPHAVTAIEQRFFGRSL